MPMAALYCVVWKDAHGGANTGWRELEELVQAKVATAVSCGAILVNDQEKLIVCPHLIIENSTIIQGDAEIVIPQQWVLSVTKLGEIPCQKAPEHTDTK